MKKEFVCINCPMGCRLTAQIENGAVSTVDGNSCRRGIEYAKQEAVLPMRTLTALMKPAGTATPIPVRTTAAIPKSLLIKCADEIKKYRPQLPIHCGDILVRNIMDTGADIIATADITK